MQPPRTAVVVIAGLTTLALLASCGGAGTGPAEPLSNYSNGAPARWFAQTRAAWGEDNFTTCEIQIEGASASLGDTFAGVVKWHPDRCSLGMHLKSVIRSRLSHELERAEHLKHVSLPDVGDRRATEAMAVDAAPSASGRRNRFAEEFTARLRELAADDAAVLQLIDCYSDGVTERRKVCRATGMTTTTFHNADRRLQRLVTNLPEELRMAALGAMSRDEP